LIKDIEITATAGLMADASGLDAIEKEETRTLERYQWAFYDSAIGVSGKSISADRSNRVSMDDFTD